jgi:hypothetical protein
VLENGTAAQSGGRTAAGSQSQAVNALQIATEAELPEEEAWWTNTAQHSLTKSWMGAHHLQEQPPRQQVLDDTVWQAQQRVPVEVQQVQPERIKIPEFQETAPAKPTVIVPQSTQFQKVKWNEFPEEEQKEQGSVPRVRAQEWVPENEQEHPVVKTTYQPGRIARAWPPPGYNENEEQELTRASATKTVSDDGWIQNANAETEEDQDAVGNAPWRRQVGGGGLKSRAWPPPEQEQDVREISGGPKLAVQWPPAEFEEKTQQDVEIIQTHFTQKPHQRQWPPVQPEAQQPVEAQ